MPVGAVIGASVIGAGANALTAKSASKTQAAAAREAAAVQSAAADRAAQTQLQIYGQSREDLSPYRVFGQSALPGVSALLGIPQAQQTGQPTSAGIPSAFTGGLTAGQPNWQAYLQADPGIAQEYQRQMTTAPGYLQSQGINSLQDYAQWHWNNTGQGEQGRLNPFTGIRVGESAVDPQYASMFQQAAAPAAAGTGAAPQVFDSQARQAFLESTPGYQFTKDQGMKAISSSLYAKGLGGRDISGGADAGGVASGALGKGLARFVTGLADQTYGNQYQRYLDAAKLGETAASTGAQVGTQAGANIANTMVGGAQAQASGITGAANANAAGTIATGQAIGNIANAIPGAVITNKVLGMYQPTQTTQPGYPMSTSGFGFG